MCTDILNLPLGRLRRDSLEAVLDAASIINDSSHGSPTAKRGLAGALGCLNHVSRVCKDVRVTAGFYCEILGFKPIRRPHFDFEGAW